MDRGAKKDRIRQWIQNSVIEECDEEEHEEIDEDSIKIIDNQNGPIGEMVESRGPISESKIRLNGRREHHSRHRRERRHRSPQVYKPPIDPRIPLQLQTTSGTNKNSNTSSESALSTDSSNYTIKNGNLKTSQSSSSIQDGSVVKEVRFDMSRKEEFVKSKSLVYNESAIQQNSASKLYKNKFLMHF